MPYAVHIHFLRLYTLLLNATLVDCRYRQYHIKEIGIDRWNASQLITNLQGDGFTTVPIGMKPTSEILKRMKLTQRNIKKPSAHGCIGIYCEKVFI